MAEAGSSNGAPESGVAQVTIDAITNFHATHQTIEWQRYLLSPREISFIEYYREILGPDESALLAEVEFDPMPSARAIREDEGWTTGLDDLLGRMEMTQIAFQQ